MDTSDTLNLAAVQMVSSTSADENLRTAQRLVRQAAEQGADWVVLPEYWAAMGLRDTDKLALAEPFGSGRLQEAMAKWAVEYRIVLFGGSVPLQSSENGKICNSLLVYGKSGECLSRYDKMHLFDFHLGSEHYAESDTISAGSRVPQLDIGGWRVAQGICYDLRFPELFRAQLPFDVLVLPAAFTHTTGKAHWELLLRTRAVENQCFVVASAQGGQHENGLHTFGHSMVIDPWGRVLAVRPENEGIAAATVSRVELETVRRQLPALQHRRLK